MKPTDTFTKDDILEGLALRQFEVYYQPIIEKSDNTILSGEALIRWNHPKLGFLHPLSFISITEKLGAMGAMGEFVLREACMQSKKWKDEGHDFHKVTVNLSLCQLIDENFPKKVIQIVSDTEIEPSDLELEITESMAMTDPAATRETLLKLKEIGIRIILDDFGTGYSSLSHLRHFPVDGLKIDGQFIQQSLQSEKDTKMMRAIITLARALDLHIVAEGVETEEQLALLKEMECETVQGFYFTHPLPTHEYKEWCKVFLSNPAFTTNSLLSI
jgi:EAL domain-containing protein (putative c-di-GMP-specific phosphodiesterase class I)